MTIKAASRKSEKALKSHFSGKKINCIFLLLYNILSLSKHSHTVQSRTKNYNKFKIGKFL